MLAMGPGCVVLRPLPVLLRPRRGVVTLNVKEGENVPVRCSALLALLTYPHRCVVAFK